MDLMPDRHVTTVTSTDGRQVLLDPRQHRAQVIRRLLTAGVTADTLRAIVPEWSSLISEIDGELHRNHERVLTIS